MNFCKKTLSMSIYLTLSLTLFACNSKEYKEDQNSNVEIIKALNTGDNDKVINFLENKDKDLDDAFYLASAYASKGGLDIYSMYPILEVKLFHEKAINWSSKSETDNKYVKIIKKRESQTNQSKEDKEAVWMDSEEKLKKRFDIHKDLDCSVYRAYNVFCENLNYEINLYIEDRVKENKVPEYLDLSIVNTKADEVLGFNFFKTYNSDVSAEDQNLLYSIFYDVQSYNEKKLEYENAKINFISPPKLGELTSADAPLVMMNLLWTTYEAIPILQSLPKVDLDQQEHISKAIKELVKLAKTSEYKKKASTFLYSLSLFSLISIYSDSFDFDKVNSPQDLYCQFKPERLIKNYGVVRERFDVLITHGREALLPKEYLEDFNKHYEIFKNTPEKLDQKEISKFVEKIKRNQNQECSLESIL